MKLVYSRDPIGINQETIPRFFPHLFPIKITEREVVFPFEQDIPLAILGEIFFMNTLPIEQDCWYVYILRCNQGRLQIGCSHDLTEKTAPRDPCKMKNQNHNFSETLLGYTVFQKKQEAVSYERYLRGVLGLP